MTVAAGDGTGDTADFSAVTGAGITFDMTQADQLTGGPAHLTGGTFTGFENVTGGSGSDALTGDAGANILIGGGGTDTLTGGDDVGTSDTAAYDDARADYAVGVTAFDSVTESAVTVTDEGVDTLTGIEVLQFDGTTLDLADPVQLLNGSGALIGTFDTIQAAVDAASDGETILVSAGTYREQVEIDGFTGLTIKGVGGTVTLEAPDTLSQTSTSGSGRSMFAIVDVEGSTGVTLEDIDVDGRGITSGLSGTNPNNVGVNFRNSSGGLTNVDVSGIHDPCPGGTTVDGFPIQSGNQRGVGVQVDNDTLSRHSWLRQRMPA